MNTRDQQNRDRREPCVWASARVVAYRPCDREFDCDHCDLYRVLSRQQRRKPRGHLAWPSDRRYTFNHLWVEPADHDRARIGLTPLGAELLHPVDRWETYRSSTNRTRPLAAITAATASGHVVIPLPGSVEIYQINPRLAVDPLWPLADPWETGYLADISTGARESELNGFVTLAEIEPHVLETRHRLFRSAAHSGHYEQNGVRTADGGMPVAGWIDALGHSMYRRFLRECFHVRRA